jgi:extracellular elastinolytic metalloproteinase
MRPKRLLAVAVPMLVVVAGAPPASGVVAPRAQGQHANRSADFFDVRAQARGIASRMAPAARGPQAVASVDRLTGTARNLARLDGTLSGPAAGSPRDVAWRFARAHAPEIGITAADFASFGSATVRTSRSGITSVRWRQLFRGVPALDNGLRVHLDRGNRVLSVQGSPVHGLRVGSVTPELSAEQALRALMDSVGARRAVTVTSRSSDARRETRFSTGDRARLVLFHGRGTRLAWSVTYRASSTAWYHAVVDARTGEVLRRSNLVDHATPVTVFENYPGAPNGGTQQPRDLETLGYVPAGATTLSGPFAQTYLDVDDSDTADAGENVAPGVYPFQSFNLAVGADGFCQPAKLCAWDPDVRDSWETNRQEAAVQAHYYVSRFHDHLRNSPAAFTADEGNFEDADRVIVNANDGADTEGDGGPDIFHVDNANMATPPDGDSPRMQMYLFEPFTDEGAPFRAINGDDDATIVYHEYTHGLSSRLVTDAEGVQALNSFQAGSMGEAWSDWYAKDFLVRQGLELDDPDTDADS